MINILQRDKVDHCSGATRAEALDEEGETGGEEEDDQDDQDENTKPLLTSEVKSRINILDSI